MPNNIIDLADKETLENLKIDLQKDGIDPKDILQEYYDKYRQEKNYEEITSNVTFGNNRNIQSFKKDIANMIPCSKPQNYEGIKQAKGPWKNIYEIAFGGETIEVITRLPKEEKKKQMKIEAA